MFLLWYEHPSFLSAQPSWKNYRVKIIEFISYFTFIYHISFTTVKICVIVVLIKYLLCILTNYGGVNLADQTTYIGYIFENVENGFLHNPYNHEYRETNAIQNGDVENLRIISKEDFTGRYGTLSTDPLRQEIYMGIVMTTLASRAAIRGGLLPETAFYLSDYTIQSMDKCSDPEKVKQIARNAQMQYAKLVADIKRTQSQSAASSDPAYSRHVSHCKDYVSSHLHEKLTVKQIAAAVGVNANYLSTLFKKCEHISLKQYILNEKIKLAKNMLVYSRYSYIQIANYLGFSSQSHMGEEFRKVTGYTPARYRELFGRDDFMKEIQNQEDDSDR